MASQKNFAITPSVSISRSKFHRPSQHKTSFNLGDIVPIYVDADILPGDTVSMDLSTLIRMSTPVAPIMDNIHIDYYAFFVPNRLVYDKWKQFMGENTTSYGAATDPGYPVADIGVSPCGAGSIGNYMGLPELTAGQKYLGVSALPGRAYCLIYNEWFRDQNLISPLSIDTSLGSFETGLGSDPNDSGAVIQYSHACFKAAKDSDYFTRALPYAQKGNPVQLPLGDFAKLKVTNVGYPLTNSKNGVYPSVSILTNVKNSEQGSVEQLYTAGGAVPTQSNLVVDLSTATAATINQLRFAFQYQKFLEKDALYGTRYWEILKGHFGITAPDASLQRPELLGHFRQHINIDQVLQTSAQTGEGTILGTPGANSVSGKSDHLISKSFVEHGILMILAVARHDQTYGQGINRMWSRTKRTDFYFPVFANLGAQEIKTKEIFASDNVSQNESIFGYQEAWAEYRYKPNQVSGVINPSSKSSSLGFWTLANNFASAPTLSKSFIEQNRNNIQRALVTGDMGPDFIADFYFDSVYVRPMPMYSLPGLIDHH